VQRGVWPALNRDRGDGENGLDELKNQQGWGASALTTWRCRLAARLVALFWDWWNIFTRLAEPDRHREAISSRPLLLLHAIAERARHARQTTIKIASMRQARSRRKGASSGSPVPEAVAHKCTAVDALAACELLRQPTIVRVGRSPTK
jgi:hypothetical protein